jgi:hypothetical protein
MTSIEKEIDVLAREFAAKLVGLTETDMRQQAFAAVSDAMTTVGHAGKASTGTTKQVARPAKRSLHLSPKGLAARKLQGHYLGMLRGFTAEKRARVKKVAQEQGVAAAIKLGKTLK